MSTAPTATTYTHDDVVGLAMTIRGRVVLPVNTREFRAELERSHNCGFWSRHPLMFVLCHDAPDVQRALEFCKRFQLPLSVRSGGHSACGSSVKDGTVVIDLSRMRRIQYVSCPFDLVNEPPSPKRCNRSPNRSLFFTSNHSIRCYFVGHGHGGSYHGIGVSVGRR